MAHQENEDWLVLHRDQVQGLNHGVSMILESGVYPWVVGVISCHRNTQRDTYTDEEKKDTRYSGKLVQDDLEQKTSEALTTETKKQLSRNRGEIRYS